MTDEYNRQDATDEQQERDEAADEANKKPVRTRTDLVILGKRFKELIEFIGPNMKQFCRDVNIAYRSMRDYVSGRREPGIHVVWALMRHTRVSGEWLIMGEGPMFHDQGPKLARIDHDLLAKIACALQEQNFKTEADQAADDDDDDYLYSNRREARRKQLANITQSAVQASSIYNRVATIEDDQYREQVLAQEVISAGHRGPHLKTKKQK